MGISVSIPKDLSHIHTRVIMNLTKRQLICFTGAAITAGPVYYFTKTPLGTNAAALLMMIVAMPFFFFALYERDGFPAEKILMHMIRQKYLTPGVRPYKTENLYTKLEMQEKLRKEVADLEEKARRGRSGHRSRK